jgi:two-component system nitrogen regulation sensor histidine kinase GlnL
VNGHEDADAAGRAAEAARIGLILVTQDLRIEYLNAAAETLLGRSRRRLIGTKIGACGPIGAAAAPLVMRALDEDREVFAHDVLVDGLGEAESLRLAIDVAPESAGVCVSFRASPEGASAARGATAATAAAGFGRMLSHELKNPLAGARGAAQLMIQSEDPEAGELAALIIRELDRARRIADRWSQVGEIVLSPLEPVNLHSLVREAVESARAAGPDGVIWEEHFDPSLPDALADADLARQSVLNLLINAAEAVGGQGGTVAVTTRYRRSRPGGPAPDARLEVTVEDDGPGVAADLQDAIFNPFVTNKPAGEGLGLALVSRIADLHGGGVEFESRPGRTVFHLYLKEVR